MYHYYADHLNLNTQLKPIQSACNLAFSIVDARNIPVPAGVEIVGRQVYVTLFDQRQVLSNVFAMPAVSHSESDSLWKFTSKVKYLLR